MQIKDLPGFDYVAGRDLVRVTIRFPGASRPEVQKSLQIMGNSVKASAKQIWREVGEPAPCEIDVEVSKSMGFEVGVDGDFVAR